VVVRGDSGTGRGGGPALDLKVELPQLPESTMGMNLPPFLDPGTRGGALVGLQQALQQTVTRLYCEP
jgi:hypothetical protein